MGKRGGFITLEGVDGAGKTTQHRLLVSYLRQLGYRVCATREPGGTLIGERIRRILVNAHDPTRGGTGPSPVAELILMYAAREQLLGEVIRPALARGQIVVSDRFNDASFAYQGYGRKLGAAAIRPLDRLVCGQTQPDLTLLLDLSPRVALDRAQGRQARRKSALGRFEAQGLAFQKRVRAGYLTIARHDPRRVKIVRAHQPPATLQAEIRRLVDKFLARRK